MFKRCFGCMRELPAPDEPCPHCGYDRRAATFNRNHLPPGSTLGDRYVIGQALGLGSFGITYIGWDDVGQTRVTIKEFLPSAFALHRAGDPQVQFYSEQGHALFEEGLRRFGEETSVLRSLTQAESVSAILDYVRENGTGYAVMEYLSGQTLKARLAQCRTMTFDEAMEILAPVLRTLDEVHRNGLLHRDISPDNIFLCDDGRVKLLDFGSAQYELMRDDSEGLPVVLKHGYSPPEQYGSALTAGPWTDVFGAAATLYKMLTGIVPPDAPGRGQEDTLLLPSEVGCVLDQQAESAIMRALALAPEDRFPTADAFLEALEPSSDIEDGRHCRRWIIPVAAALVVIAAAVCAVVLHGRRPPAKPVTSDVVSVPESVTQYMASPSEGKETYYEGFQPDSMEPVYTAAGAPASVPYALFMQDGKCGLVGMDGTVALPASRTTIVWDTAQQLFLLDGSVYWDAQNGSAESAVIADAPQAYPDLRGSTYQYTDALYRVTASGDKILQQSSEGAFLVDGPSYGIAVRGTLTVEQKYDAATPLSCGVSALREDGKWKYRSVFGADLFGVSFESSLFPNGIPYSFSEGYVPLYDAETGLWGYGSTAGSNATGIFAVEPRYQMALPPVQGVAWVKTDQGYGTLRFGESEQICGQCGENVQYVYDSETGLLRIVGTGNMWDFTAENVPWLYDRRRIRTIRFEGSVTYLGANSFADCTALSSVVLPAALEAIGPFAFRGCGMLHAIGFPPSLLTIGDEAFAGCGDLAELALPASLQSIGLSAFRSCTAMQNMMVSAPISLPDWTFYGCTALQNADLSAVTAVGSHVFEGCTALRTVRLPARNATLGAYAFSGCALLENVQIPLGTTTLETAVFLNCTSLQSVVLPDGLRTVGQEAFSGCSSLASLSLPPTLTQISARAFYGCRGLRAALVPDSVTRIDDYAFALCTGITSFDLKDTVKVLGVHVFDGWTSRQSIRLKNPLLKRWLGTPAGWSDGWDAGCSASIAPA